MGISSCGTKNINEDDEEVEDMINPNFIRVTPLVAWLIVLLAYAMTGMLFIVGEPIVSAIFAITYSEIPDQAVGPANTLRLLFYAIPIVIDLLLSLWAFLVTTRRQPVTYPGPVF